MRNFSKILAGVGILVIIAGIGLLVGWWGTQGPAPKVPPPPPLPPAGQPSAADQAPPPSPVAAAARPAVTAAPLTNPPAASPATNPNADWEAKLDDILGSETDDTNKVAQLFELFPQLPEDGQIDVAQHLSNLVPDENYAPLGKLLKNASLPESVLDTLMSDALNRPNSIKLPVLLDVAQDPANPEAGEAKDLLELYLDEDYGTNWDQWRQKLQEWLKQNPD
jgi:hypothetical protein